MKDTAKTLVKIKNLKKYFEISKHEVLKAVDDVSFDIYEGETLGLVGESGCGKSTTGRCLVKLYEPTEGEIHFEDEKINALSKSESLNFAKKVQMIFQNPYSSLNPRMTVKDIIAEGIRLHESLKEKEVTEKVYELLNIVGLNKDHASRFPHEFSGGQRQRIGIARALSVNPKFIVCDEPISALDVSIQAQVINLLKKFQKQMNLTYLFIAHDLSVVKYISDRVVVMYLGAIVEQARSEDLYKNPLHPYTKALLSSIPIADPKLERSRERIVLEGDVPSPINPPDCCKFVERCKYAKAICKEKPPVKKMIEEEHFVACHLY